MPVPICTADEVNSLFAPIGGGRCNNIQSPSLANKDQPYLRLLPACERDIFDTRDNLIGHNGRSQQLLDENPFEFLRKSNGSSSSGRGKGNEEGHQEEGGEGESGEGAKVGVWKSPHPDSIHCNTGNKLPNARLVSRTIHVDQDAPSTVNHLFPMFAQFLCHDVMLTNIQTIVSFCCGQSSQYCMPISVPSGDTVFAEKCCMDFKRAVPFCTPNSGPSPSATERRYQNLLSSFIDAENIYRNDLETTTAIRAPFGGRLMDTPNHLLPVLSIKGDFTKLAGGDSRASDNPALVTVHTLFMREHNRISDQIASANHLLTNDQV